MSSAHGEVVVEVVRIISSESFCVGRHIYKARAENQRGECTHHRPSLIRSSCNCHAGRCIPILSFILTLSSWPGLTMPADNGYSALSVGGNLAPKSAKFALSVLRCLA